VLYHVAASKRLYVRIIYNTCYHLNTHNTKTQLITAVFIPQHDPKEELIHVLD
jgi:hypothetical protein